ncbi:MAG: shikimate kinase [Lachnospiraceae bacterium]|nr:shikimate kinase [Agathobacter sp.]MDD6445314.1 shikimate kinase [Lachnospiraceae bacterium]MDY4893456.1 shikimate kinase [Agathobacter sp.]
MSKIDYNIFLIGFMGAGKSTIARSLVQKLNFPLIEMDERIVKEQGMPISEIFDRYGEEHFRDIESELVKTIGTLEPSVVSCGGGTVLRPENVENMKKSGKIVFLTATPQTIYERVKNSSDRPILNGHMNVPYIAELMEKRRPVYEGAAELTISTDGKSREEIADEIIRRLEE